ncbi:hypothetical protein CFter6_4694 [Collimonas fungivorans]|uniref:Uncharacterized protein n=1 Tax=Collimonas fungivorans TaxID=158899 RepID=A0A127PHQ5_9BURK|nr:hypothetical protein CFter6_4694 [Collimonas fungivorans]
MRQVQYPCPYIWHGLCSVDIKRFANQKRFRSNTEEYCHA